MYLNRKPVLTLSRNHASKEGCNDIKKNVARNQKKLHAVSVHPAFAGLSDYFQLCSHVRNSNRIQELFRRSWHIQKSMGWIPALQAVFRFIPFLEFNEEHADFKPVRTYSRFSHSDYSGASAQLFSQHQT